MIRLDTMSKDADEPRLIEGIKTPDFLNEKKIILRWILKLNAEPLKLKS